MGMKLPVQMEGGWQKAPIWREQIPANPAGFFSRKKKAAFKALVQLESSMV
jgi:hypothetical protein